MHRRIIGLVAILAALAPVASARPVAEKTVVNDRAAARMLLGRHMLSLQWISWEVFGTAMVEDRDGTYVLTGSQRQRGGDDVLEIDGIVTRVDATEFTFRGKITTRVSYINGGAPCVRDGEYTFVIRGSRKYWRMTPFDNPCDEAADYVDIYFRR
jgi:hypothetical protein